MEVHNGFLIIDDETAVRVDMIAAYHDAHEGWAKGKVRIVLVNGIDIHIDHKAHQIHRALANAGIGSLPAIHTGEHGHVGGGSGGRSRGSGSGMGSAVGLGAAAGIVDSSGGGGGGGGGFF